MVRLGLSALLVAALLWPAAAEARKGIYRTKGGKIKVRFPNRADELPPLPYKGVTMKGGAPPKAKKPLPQGVTYVTWPGFRSTRKTGTEIFIQMTSPVSYKVRKRRRRVSVTLDNARVYLRNTLRSVVTKHFPGPVARFRVRRLRRKRLRLDVWLRRRAVPSVTMTSQGKYTFLVISFPPQG